MRVGMHQIGEVAEAVGLSLRQLAAARAMTEQPRAEGDAGPIGPVPGRRR